MISFLITKKNYERLLPLVELVGSMPTHYSRIRRFGIFEIRESKSQSAFITNYNGYYCRPEKVDFVIPDSIIQEKGKSNEKRIQKKHSVFSADVYDRNNEMVSSIYHRSHQKAIRGAKRKRNAIGNGSSYEVIRLQQPNRARRFRYN